jgi:hypothetical protein
MSSTKMAEPTYRIINLTYRYTEDRGLSFNEAHRWLDRLKKADPTMRRTIGRDVPES